MTLSTRSLGRPEASLPRPGTIQIFTFKEGLLSRLAHDLCVGVRSFEIELRNGQVFARFDVLSARVDGVVQGERVDPNRFSRQDTDVIERNMRDAILNAARFPVVELEGAVHPSGIDRWSVRGRLKIVGQTCEIEVPVTRVGTELLVDLDITPSAWGIKPFTTMGGAIGIQDRWRVRVRLALGAHAPGALLRQEGVVRWVG